MRSNSNPPQGRKRASNAEALDLKMKKLARLSYYNAVRLFKDACILYQASSFPSSYYLTLSSMEEAGKVNLVDHFFADMCLNHEALGYDKSIFLNSLLLKHNFYNHREKTERALEITGLDFPLADRKKFKELNDWFANSELERQKSIYVGMTKHDVISPEKHVTKTKNKKALKLALKTIEELYDMGLVGTYWSPSKNCERKAMAIAEEIKRLYKSVTQ